MLLKVAVGDFNHDGYENEVAMFTSDKKGVYLCYYQVTYDTRTANFSIKEMPNTARTLLTYGDPAYITKWSYNGSSRLPGGDVVAGDFDGDGKTELAAIFYGDFSSSSRNTDEGARLHGATAVNLFAHLYKWNNTTGKLDAIEYNNGRFGMTYTVGSITASGKSVGTYYRLIMPWGGLKAVKVDINGDGTDEIAVEGVRSKLLERMLRGRCDYATYTAYPYIALVQRDKSDGKLKAKDIYTGTAFLSKRFTRLGDPVSKTNPFGLEEYQLMPVNEGEGFYPLVDRTSAIVAGPFFGTGGVIKPREDLALRYYGAHMPLFKSNGSTLAQEGAELKGTDIMALVAADFTGEGIELGTPTHIINPADRSYMAILQAPPYHVDNISADGKSLTTTPTNFSYIKGAMTTYAKSSNATEKNNTKFDVKNTVETIFALGDAGQNVVGGYKTAKSIYGVVKTVAGFIPGVGQYAKKADGVVGKVTNFLDSCIDKVDTIKKGYDQEIKSLEVRDKISTERLDAVYLAEANQNVWRYPIITKPAPDFSKVYSIDSYVDAYITKQDFVTFTLYDDVQDRIFNSDSSYQPTHENGNLFSYPSNVANIEGYDTKQKTLSGIKNVQLGTTTVESAASFTEVKEHDETNSKEVTKGFLSRNLSILDGILGTDFAKVPKNENSTYTRTEQKNEQIIINLPNADGSKLLEGYNMQYQAYVAENGAVMCGFAVNKLNKNLDLFNSSSLYGTKSDPSFVLPYKFVLTSNSSFGVNTNRMVAMEMRGVRFYSVDYNQYTSGRLLEGSKYRIEIPIYNASFVPVSNVKVKLYWVNNREEASLEGKVLIGESQAINMTGWVDDGNNKAWARIEFTPTNMKDGNYQFYAVIDYAGDEVHKTRSDSDPGGNNEGYFDFSVENVNSSNTVQSIMLRAGNPDITYNDKQTWKEFFNEFIANATAPVYMTVKITNNMASTIPDMEIKATYKTNQATEEAVFVKNITLFPNEMYTFNIVIDAEFVEKLQKAGVDSTDCSYTINQREESSPTLTGLLGNTTFQGDADPKLDVFTAETETNNGLYFDSVVTKTYELSSDIPVFWRISDIFEDHSISSDNDVEASEVEDNQTSGFLDDFNITWDPSDAGTVKTDNVTITISTIPGKTLKGDYSFNVQTSEDGITWNDHDILTLNSADASNSSNSTGSSSGGCNSDLSAIGLGFVLITMFSKKIRCN